MLDLDSFGEIMDRMIEDHRVVLLIEMPAGTTEAEMRTNMPGGGTVELYLLLAAIPTAVRHIADQFRGGSFDGDKIATAICEMLRKDIAEAFEEAQHGDEDRV